MISTCAGFIFPCMHELEWLEQKRIFIRTDLSVLNWVVLFAGGSTCPLTNVPLKCPVTLRPIEHLRSQIEAYAADHGLKIGKAEYGTVRFIRRQGKTEMQSEEVQTPRRKILSVAKSFVRYLFSPDPVLIARRNPTGRSTVQFLR